MCQQVDSLEDSFENEPISNMDKELKDDLLKLWDAKDMLTMKQRERIKQITNESYLD